MVTEASEKLTSTPPTDTQVDAIQGLSFVMFRDRDLVFETCGIPTDRGDASLLLSALHCVRNNQPTHPGAMSEYAERIRQAMQEQPRIELKSCSRCRKDKPTTEFHKNKSAKDGYNHWCKTCTSAVAKARKPKNPARPRKSFEPLPEQRFAPLPDLVLEPDPPLSEAAVGSAHWSHPFENPSVVQLDSLKRFLLVDTYDEAIAVCRWITAFVTKGSAE